MKKGLPTVTNAIKTPVIRLKYMVFFHLHFTVITDKLIRTFLNFKTRLTHLFV